MVQGWNNIKNVAKTGAEYTPYVGDVYDIARGTYQAMHGHPWLGTGQALLGGAGLASNILFPGAGSAVKAGVKAGVKGAVKGATKKAVKKEASNVVQEAPSLVEKFYRWNRTPKGMATTSIAPEVGYYIMPKTGEMQGANNGQNNTPPLEPLPGDVGNSNIGNITPQQANQLASQINSQANTNIKNQQVEASPEGIQAINDYVAQLQQVNRPYIDNLKKYYNNYANLLDQQQRAAGYWNGIAALTGNKNWANMANYYNPVVNEANKLSVLKQIQDAEAGDINAINELMGNLSMAQEMGLPPEAAFANKNLLTMMAAKDREANRYQIALENNLMKKYGIDRNYAKALITQRMRNQNAIDVANVYMGGGMPGIGLNQGGTPINQKQQALNNLYNR